MARPRDHTTFTHRVSEPKSGGNMADKPTPAETQAKISIIEQLLDVKVAKLEVARLHKAAKEDKGIKGAAISEGSIRDVVEAHLMPQARQFFNRLCRAWEHDLP